MQNISVTLIAKNEEKNISKCLECISKYGFEIIVVDTGSIDKTKEISLKYTDKVYDFEWIDDFSAARNFAAEKASFEYIFALDCDEYVYELNKELLFKQINENKYAVGRMFRENELSGDNIGLASKERVSRIYSKEKYHFEGRIHEQLVSKNKENYITFMAPVFCKHSGYLGTEEERKNKADRNIRLLEISLKENGKNPYDLYQLGKGYFFRKEYNKAVEYFSAACEYDLNPSLEYVKDMIVSFGYSLLNNNNISEAMSLEGVYDDFKYSADYLFVMGLIFMQNSEFEKAITSFYEATKIKDAAVEGVNSFSANYNIGVIYECLGDNEKAKKYYKKCGEYKRAVERLDVLK